MVYSFFFFSKESSEQPNPEVEHYNMQRSRGNPKEIKETGRSDYQNYSDYL